MPERVTAFLRMSVDIIAEVNAELARRRRAAIRADRPSQMADLLDADLACLLEVALAHDIMLARAPRPGNLLAVDIDQHLRRRADGGITIEIPKHLVKTRVDLSIPRITSDFFVQDGLVVSTGWQSVVAQHVGADRKNLDTW